MKATRVRAGEYMVGGHRVERHWSGEFWMIFEKGATEVDAPCDAADTLGEAKEMIATHPSFTGKHEEWI